LIDWLFTDTHRTVFTNSVTVFSDSFRSSVSSELYVVVNPSVVCLSVMFVRPTQPVEIFCNVCTPFVTLAIHWHPGKILWRSSPNLCSSLLYFVVCVRCRRKETSRSLSHLLVTFLFIMPPPTNRPLVRPLSIIRPPVVCPLTSASRDAVSLNSVDGLQ